MTVPNESSTTTLDDLPQPPMPSMPSVEVINRAKALLGIPEMFQTPSLVSASTTAKKKGRKLYNSNQIVAMLKAFGRAKANNEYDAVKNSDWKSKSALVEKDMDKIREEIPEFDWTMKSIKDKWDVLKSAFLSAKREQLGHTGGGECPVIEHNALWNDIYPNSHPALQPAQLAESGKGKVLIRNNDVALAAEKAPPKPSRKRKAEEDAELSKHMKMLIDKELSSDPAQLKLAGAQAQANRLRAMELVRDMSQEEMKQMKEKADFLLL